MISSLARPRPTTAGRRVEPPTSGMIPNLTSGRPSWASLEAIRRSQPSATSSAPPTHVRWIWQTTGLAISSQRFAQSRKTLRNGRSMPGVAGRGRQLDEVHAGREHRALAAQHDAVHRRVGGGLAQRVAERQQQLLVHRVALLGAVQDDVADGAAVLGDDDAHRRLLTVGCVRGWTRASAARCGCGGDALGAATAGRQQPRRGSARVIGSRPRPRELEAEVQWREIEKVGVLGAGLMGHGIAQVAAQAGYEVVLREVDEATLAEGHRQDREAARARGREGQVQPGGRRRGARRASTGTTDYGDLADCDLVIEAITENLAAEARDVARGRRDRQAGGGVRDQHLLAGR